MASLKIAEYLSAFFLDVLRLTPSGLIEVVYLCANKVNIALFFVSEKTPRKNTFNIFLLVSLLLLMKALSWGWESLF